MIIMRVLQGPTPILSQMIDFCLSVSSTCSTTRSCSYVHTHTHTYNTHTYKIVPHTWLIICVAEKPSAITSYKTDGISDACLQHLQQTQPLQLLLIDHKNLSDLLRSITPST